MSTKYLILTSVFLALFIGGVTFLTAGCCSSGGDMDGGKHSMTDDEKAAAAKVQAAGFAYLTASQLEEKLASDNPPILVDVLSPESYAKQHIKGAINVYYKNVAAEASKKLPDKNADIVVYCGSFSCGASLKGAKALRDLGYTNISDYKGGLKDWSKKGKPMVYAPGESGDGSGSKSHGSDSK
jgi:rhodanese-related sulfurtransferase